MNGRIEAPALEAWTARVLQCCELPAHQAAEAAAVLVRSELRGYSTHGMTRMASYVERLRAGDFKARPEMRHSLRTGGVVLDADAAMGQVAGPHALRLGLAALGSSASVLVAIRSCGHLGALGIHALAAAEAGAFCLVGQRTPPMLAAPGFARAAIGHNPIAFGCPHPRADPVVFDIACSVAARGHILQAARDGRPIPAGWAVDADGAPTTDTRRALDGALLPMGGHKGMGIAMMVECLAGAIAASAESLEPGGDRFETSGAAGRQAAFLWLVKPESFVAPELFDRSMAKWINTYCEAGGDAAHLPGIRGAALEALGRGEGMALGAAIESELSALGERFAVPFPVT